MIELPSPPVPAECDLRDFGFMPLDVVRLRDSEIAAVADAEIFRAAVLCWCVAWHQVPAASLPDDDGTICRLIGMGRDKAGWLALREAGALRGFIKCSDGRLYHEVVAEKARTSWEAKLARRDRTEKARQARQSQRQQSTHESSVTDDVTTSVVPDTEASKGEVRESEGKGREESPSLCSGDAGAREWPSVWAAFKTWPGLPAGASEQRAREAWERLYGELPPDLTARVEAYGAALRRENESRGKAGRVLVTHPHNWLDRDRGWLVTVTGPSPAEVEAARDKADLLLKRGKYDPMKQAMQ